MTDSKPCRDTTINKEECSNRYSPNLCSGDTQFTAGDCVSLSCNKVQGHCSYITWLFTKKNGRTVELIAKGKVKSENDTQRLRVTETCSLEVNTLREEDEGVYICRHFLSSGGSAGRARHDLHLITPTASASWATLGALPQVLVLLVFSVLTLVVLIHLIGWCYGSRRGEPKRTTQVTTGRGNRKPAEEGMGLNSASNARECLGPGAFDEDLDGAPRGPSVVQRGEQRPVGSAQVQVDPAGFRDAVTYNNVRASPRYVGEPPDTGVHFVTVHQLSE